MYSIVIVKDNNWHIWHDNYKYGSFRPLSLILFSSIQLMLLILFFFAIYNITNTLSTCKKTCRGFNSINSKTIFEKRQQAERIKTNQTRLGLLRLNNPSAVLQLHLLVLLYCREVTENRIWKGSHRTMYNFWWWNYQTNLSNALQNWAGLFGENKSCCVSIFLVFRVPFFTYTSKRVGAVYKYYCFGYKVWMWMLLYDICWLLFHWCVGDESLYVYKVEKGPLFFQKALKCAHKKVKSNKMKLPF